MSIQVFKNEQFGEIRTVLNENKEPMFCLADICKSIGLSNPSSVSSRLDEEDRAKIDLGRDNQLFGNTVATFVTESGLYQVILGSDSPKVRPFKKWVTNDVLPSIRNHGAYMTNEAIEKALTSPDFLIQLANQLKSEQQARFIAETKIKQQAPKVLFANALVAAENSILIGRLATILKQNGIDIGQNRLFKWLRNNGYLCKTGERYNQPTQQAMESGLFEVNYNTVVRSDKSIQTVTTKVTGKGQMYFINKFLNTN